MDGSARGRDVEDSEALVEASLDGVLFVSKQRIVTANTLAGELLGVAPEALVGRQLPGLVVPAHADSVRELCRRAAAEGHARGDATLVRADGSETAVLLSLRAARTPGHAVVVLRDQRERRRLEEQLRHSQKLDAMGRLAGGIAHDFNNLTTAIRGFADILVRGLDPASPHRRHAEQILRAGERAGSLTRQLLAFSRKRSAESRVLDPNAAIGELEGLLRRLLREDIALETRLSPGVGWISIDPSQLEQVLVNLVVNARDATPGRGTVTIATSPCEAAAVPPRTGSGYLDAAAVDSPALGPHVVIAVSDTGTGMSAEVREHAFEPFFTTKAAGHGTGFGLATVHAVVREAGGTVSLESAPGTGTTVRAYLPCVPAPGTPMRAEPRRGGASGTEKVLVVEDDEGVLTLAAIVLRESGFAVLEARDGQEALELWNAASPRVDLVVSDLVLPHLSGPELQQRIRDVDPATRFLFISGYADDASDTEGLEPGAAFLAKPFGPAELTRRVRAVLDAARE